MIQDGMAALHSRAAPGARAWSPEEYKQLITANHALLLIADHGFVLGQLVGDEAEIFMIIVDHAYQRRGYGLAYLNQFETRARSAGGARCFLEVATSNLVAQALYKKAGYQQVGRRKNYYKLSQTQPEAALVLQKIFTC